MPDHLGFYENAGTFEQEQAYIHCKRFKRVTYIWSDSSHSFFTCQMKIFKVREKVRESLEYHPFIRIFWHSGYIKISKQSISTIPSVHFKIHVKRRWPDKIGFSFRNFKAKFMIIRENVFRNNEYLMPTMRDI